MRIKLYFKHIPLINKQKVIIVKCSSKTFFSQSFVLYVCVDQQLIFKKKKNCIFSRNFKVNVFIFYMNRFL